MIDSKNIFSIAIKVSKIYQGFNIPLKVTQYLTFRCNLNCGFCGRTSIKSNELSTAQIIQCIKEFKNMGTEFWGFNGGEPLLRNDIGVLINTCKRLGIRTSISTNGTLIPERMEDIKEVDLVLVSIDGPQSIHNRIRGNNSFERTLKGLEELRRHNKKFIIVSVINQENIPYLEEIIKIAEYHNCLCEFQPVFMHRSDMQKKANKYIPKRMQDAAEYLAQQKKAGRPVANSSAFLQKIKSYPQLQLQPCWAKKFFCIITPDGRVYPCCVILSHEKFYNSGLDIGWTLAYRNLPYMTNCPGCFVFCYSEYNIILNNPLTSFTRIGFNLLRNQWISK